jgi:quinolinate synthase
LNKLQKDIVRLKKEKNAIILAHNYQAYEILEIADFVGDSYDLSCRAQNTDADIIVFCGVAFMAESAKLLNPHKKVLLPSKEAGCFMANRIDAEDLHFFKKDHPKAKVVSYVNTHADVKAESYICCTSANALKVVESIDAEEVIFVPDRNLAAYVQTQTKKKIIPWKRGFCFLHTNLQPEKILNLQKEYPNSEVLMHPETPLEFHKYADFILGTGGMIKRVKGSDKEVFLVATEEHMSGALKFRYPEKTFIPLMRHCTFMGEITLENTFEALQKEQYEITIPSEIFEDARMSLMRMMEV